MTATNAPSTTTLWLCVDCTLANAGYDSHEMGRTLPLIVIQFAESAKPGEITKADGHTTFSWEHCGGCLSVLPGERFEHEDHR